MGRAAKKLAAPLHALLHSIHPTIVWMPHCSTWPWQGSLPYILLLEILIRHALLPLIRLYKDDAAHITVINVCDSRTQLVGFLATNIQPGMQLLPQYFPRLLSTIVKTRKTDYKKIQLTVFNKTRFIILGTSFTSPRGHSRYAIRG
jgi:hypothetical protein